MEDYINDFLETYKRDVKAAFKNLKTAKRYRILKNTAVVAGIIMICNYIFALVLYFINVGFDSIPHNLMKIINIFLSYHGKISIDETGSYNNATHIGVYDYIFWVCAIFLLAVEIIIIVCFKSNNTITDREKEARVFREKKSQSIYKFTYEQNLPLDDACNDVKIVSLIDAIKGREKSIIKRIFGFGNGAGIPLSLAGNMALGVIASLAAAALTLKLQKFLIIVGNVKISNLIVSLFIISIWIILWRIITRFLKMQSIYKRPGYAELADTLRDTWIFCNKY